jgi:hypothetical protein
MFCVSGSPLLISVARGTSLIVINFCIGMDFIAWRYETFCEYIFVVFLKIAVILVGLWLAA